MGAGQISFTRIGKAVSHRGISTLKKSTNVHHYDWQSPPPSPSPPPPQGLVTISKETQGSCTYPNFTQGIPIVDKVIHSKLAWVKSFW